MFVVKFSCKIEVPKFSCKCCSSQYTASWLLLFLTFPSIITWWFIDCFAFRVLRFTCQTTILVANLVVISTNNSMLTSFNNTLLNNTFTILKHVPLTITEVFPDFSECCTSLISNKHTPTTLLTLAPVVTANKNALASDDRFLWPEGMLLTMCATSVSNAGSLPSEKNLYPSLGSCYVCSKIRIHNQ